MPYYSLLLLYLLLYYHITKYLIINLIIVDDDANPQLGNCYLLLGLISIPAPELSQQLAKGGNDVVVMMMGNDVIMKNVAMKSGKCDAKKR